MHHPRGVRADGAPAERLRSEEHTSELQSRPHLVCRLLLEKKNNIAHNGKPEHKVERGSNALLADVDVQCHITVDAVKTAKVTNAIDQPEAPMTSFTMQSHD